MGNYGRFRVPFKGTIGFGVLGFWGKGFRV